MSAMWKWWRRTAAILHPIVRVHPVTGRKAPAISPTYVTHIDGIPPAESRAILEYLHAHCMQVEFLFKHRWTQATW